MTREALEAALNHGMEMARDPRNALVRGPHEHRVTTVYSRWLLHVCLECHHTFREGDLVLPDPKRPERMIHDDERAGLRCWHRRQGLRVDRPIATAQEGDAVRAAFVCGLNRYWTPGAGAEAERVLRRSELVGRKCPICRHTVRVGDLVVRCRCGRACGGVFHQDVSRHLTCWETWVSCGRAQYCALFDTAPGDLLEQRNAPRR